MNAGKAAVFLRFVGYTLWPGREEDRARTVCRFCETDFVGANGPGSGKFVSAAALANAALAKWVALVTTHRSTVCSGGERLLQIHTPLIEALHALSFRIAIETNGTLTPQPEVLAQALGWEHVVYGSANMNAAIEEPGVIRQRNPHYGITVAEKQGNASDRLSKVKAVFNGAGISFEVGNDGPALLWDKFIGLVSNSSLCALLRSPMGVVQKDDDSWALYSKVFNEVVAAGRAAGSRDGS